jgi:hypothetical protein
VIVSASALTRHCGLVRKLKRDKPRTEALEAAARRGTLFHAAVEHWCATGVVPDIADDLEIQGWLDLLSSTWWPQPLARTEMAWGLSPVGLFREVAEPRPHEYEAVDGEPLLTAGRADLVEPHTRDGWITVIDWKTGAWNAPPADENLQVNAAGIALAQRFGARGYVPAIYEPRSGYWDWGEPVEMRSHEHARRFSDVKAAALLPEAPSKGPHCDACWERKGCPAWPRRP